MFSEVLKCSHCENIKRFHVGSIEVPFGSTRFQMVLRGSEAMLQVCVRIYGIRQGSTGFSRFLEILQCSVDF